MKDLFHLQWHITNLCNLRCQHCYQDDFSKENDLDWAGLKKISYHLHVSLQEWDKRACIHLTGGEPLLKPELFLLLDNLDQKTMVEELGIITNGLLVDREVVRRLLTFSKLKKVKISLDGADRETHDSVRQKGVFNRAIQNITLLRNEHAFEIILMFTVMKRNFRDLPAFFKLSRELGVNGFIIERFIPWGRGRQRMNEVLSKEDWRELINMLSSLFSVEDENSLFPYQAFQVSFHGEEPELLGAPCIIGRDGLCIMPEGSVFPCRRFPISIGNLLNDSLKQIWEESEILEKLRRKENLRGKCGRCGIEDCRGCRSLALALTGDYLGENPHCWYPLLSS